MLLTLPMPVQWALSEFEKAASEKDFDSDDFEESDEETNDLTRCPMRTAVAEGRNRKRPLFDILVTTYEVCLQESWFLSHTPWRAAIIDEAHRLKRRCAAPSRV